MEKFEKNGIVFTSFVRDGKRYLCTGNDITGKFEFAWAGEIADYVYVTGATSVVSGDENVSTDELYEKWLSSTEFEREVLGIKY